MDTRPPDEPDELDREDEDELAEPEAPDEIERPAQRAPVAPFDPLPPFAVPIVWLLGLCLVPYLAVWGWFLVWMWGNGSEPSSIGPAIAAGILWTLVCVRLFFVRRRRARRRADPKRRTPW